jgi:hypothetical protein
MSIDTNAEILARRTVLGDLVELSTIPAVWVGRDPPAVAAGLADALVGLLELDFVRGRTRRFGTPVHRADSSHATRYVS